MSLAEVAVVDANVKPKPDERLLESLAASLPASARNAAFCAAIAASSAEGAAGRRLGRGERRKKAEANSEDQTGGRALHGISELSDHPQVCLRNGRFDRAIFTPRRLRVNLKAAHASRSALARCSLALAGGRRERRRDQAIRARGHGERRCSPDRDPARRDRGHRRPGQRQDAAAIADRRRQGCHGLQFRRRREARRRGDHRGAQGPGQLARLRRDRRRGRRRQGERPLPNGHPGRDCGLCRLSAFDDAGRAGRGARRPRRSARAPRSNGAPPSTP